MRATVLSRIRRSKDDRKDLRHIEDHERIDAPNRRAETRFSGAVP
jgi:hypothetical protein